MREPDVEPTTVGEHQNEEAQGGPSLHSRLRIGGVVGQIAHGLTRVSFSGDVGQHWEEDLPLGGIFKYLLFRFVP